MASNKSFGSPYIVVDYDSYLSDDSVSKPDINADEVQIVSNKVGLNGGDGNADKSFFVVDVEHQHIDAHKVETLDAEVQLVSNKVGLNGADRNADKSVVVVDAKHQHIDADKVETLDADCSEYKTVNIVGANRSQFFCDEDVEFAPKIKERKRKLKERMALLRKLAARPDGWDEQMARIEAESKKHKENGWVFDPMVGYRIMYGDLQKYGNEFGGVSSQHSKDLCKLKREAIAIKEHLKTILNNNKKDIHSLLRSIEDVIQIVTHFYQETRDVPYNWKGRRFIPSLKRGTKIVYPKRETIGKPEHVLEFKYADESDEEDNEAQRNDVMVTHPMDFHLDILDAKIHMLVSRVGLDGLFAIVPNVCYPNKIDEKIWKEFEDFDNEECYEVDDLLMRSALEPFSIELDHPIVSTIGKFAVKAFNMACEMHVKKGQHNNLHDFELMECKYIKTATSYYFFMAIEALEEGKLGIYEAKVICNSFGGCMILCQFVLTGRKPFGTKETSGKYLKCLQSICETVEKLYLEKMTRLEALYECLEGDERSKARFYKVLLEEEHTDAVEALHRRLNSLKRTRLPDCNQMTVPDTWSHPDKDKTGMIRRAMDSGYDLYNLL